MQSSLKRLIASPDFIRVFVLRTIGNFLVLLAVFLVIKTFWQPVSEELRFFLDEKTGKEYVVSEEIPKGMLAEAGRLVRNAADINTTYEGMMNDYTKAMQLFIQSGDFDEADISLSKAVASCNTEGQRAAIKIKRKETIQLQAQEYIKRDKRKHAMLAFEKLLSIRETNSDEKRQAQTQLLRLYEQLGKVKEFYNLQKSM